MDLSAIVDQLLDFAPNPADTPPASLGSANVDDWLQVVHLQQWWLDRMGHVPRPLQEKLTLFWHGHFATSQEKVGSARDMYDQNHLFRTDGLGSFENLVQKMSKQVAMLIYLDNDPNQKGSPNENFARELMELFTLGVNQYSQDDVVAAAGAWTGHNVDYDAQPRRVYRFYSSRHDYSMKTFMGSTQAWDGPQIITRILTIEPQRSIVARFIAKKMWTFFAYPNPSTAILDTLTAAFVGSNLDIATLLRAIFLHPEFYSTTVRQGLVRTPVEWVVACLKALGLTAVERNPQWWMDQMGQQLFYPPNVAGWKNNAYWVNSTALWARADFARNLTWRAEQLGILDAVIQRDTINQHVMSAEDAVDLAYRTFNLVPSVGAVSPYVRGVLVNWLEGQRVTEYAPTYSWTHWARIELLTMMMLTPDVQLA